MSGTNGVADQNPADELARAREEIAQLKEQLAQARNLIDALPHKWFLKDTQSRYLVVNEAFAAELGTTSSAAVGKSDADFYPPAVADNYRADDKWVMRQRRPVTTIVRQEVDGVDTFQEVTKAALRDNEGNVTGVFGHFVDISERKRVEEALEYERYLLHTLMDHIPESLYFKDTACRFTRINKALAAKFKLDSTDQARGKTDFDFFGREHAERAFRDEQRVISQGQPIHEQEELENWPDGRVTWALTSKMPLTDRDGRIVGTFGLTHDITRRKWTEEQLQRQSTLLQSVLHSISDAVVVVDEHGQFVLINPAARQILRTDPNVGGDPSHWPEEFGLYRADGVSLYPADELPLIRALRGESVDNVELLMRRPGESETLWLSVDARPLIGDSDSLKGAVAAFRDITARKKAEQMLQASEERYRELLENANDIVYTHDLRGHMTSFNKAAEVLTGYSREETMGRNVLSMVAPEQVGLAREMTERKLNASGPTTYEIDLVSKDGRRVPLEVSTRLVTKDGRPVGVQGIARDITERKRAEEELQRQSRQLADQAVELERRNKEISRAYADLKDAESQLIHSEKMAAIGQLVAGLAHEINNPAAFVFTNLTVIERDLADLLAYASACQELQNADPKDVPEHLRRLARVRAEHNVDEAFDELPSMLLSARRGMERIRDLVASLRSYSRLDVRGDSAMADLVEGLKATLVLVAPAVGKRVDVRMEATELPLVECNAGQINQVFMNLIVNAVQAVGEEGTVSITGARDERGVSIAIQDTGPGIPENIRSRIFDPFFTTKEVGKGTGLGLSIARRIVDSHHGRIDIESTVGRGATFRVWLPLRQTPIDSA